MRAIFQLKRHDHRDTAHAQVLSIGIWLIALSAAFVMMIAPVGAQGTNAATASSAASVEDRVSDIEQRLIDAQVEMAALRSLAANAAPAATGFPGHASYQPYAGAAKAGEQVAALEREVQSLATEMGRLSGRPSPIQPGATIARQPSPSTGGLAPQVALNQPGYSQQGLNQQGLAQPGAGTGAASGWFGSTTVTPSAGASGGVGEILPGAVLPGRGGGGFNSGGDNVAGWGRPQSPAPFEPNSGAPNADTLNNGQGAYTPQAAPGAAGAEAEYQTAYGYLLQQDYGAARTAFTDFIVRHPSASLAGNAQYWIGETHFVGGDYKNAAVAFLKGFEKYGDGNKGPDSLLKLALSLAKLNQNAAACSSLRELGTRYPSAPGTILARGKSEMQRLRC